MNAIEKILFLDIETVPEVSSLDELPGERQRLWTRKAEIISRYQEESEPEQLYERAGIYAEFGRIICISLGFLHLENGQRQFRVNSFAQDSEKEILTELFQLLESFFPARYKFLCAHNGKEFDFPYICRRALINGLKLPAALQIAGKKPWETAHLLDTMQLWRFGDYKHFTSLELLASCFKLPSPKDDISGADVARVYYEEKDIDRIRKYCENDVFTLARVYCAMNGIDDIREEDLYRIQNQ